MDRQKPITRTLYIPIEIFYRELGGALLLSSYAVSRGWQVVLGGKQAIFTNMSRFKKMPGVFFLKSIVPGETYKQIEIAGFGHKIVSLDVEGLVPSNGESGVRLRYNKESIALADLLFFWSRNHYNSVYRVYPEIKGKSVISGSPIIDEILIRKKDITKSKKGFKRPRILIGTSCAYANHINGIDFAKRMTKDAYSSNLNNKESSELENEALLDEKIFDYWKEVIPRIAREFKDCEIVLRPHPSENKKFWESHVKSFKNVKINEAGSIIDKMLQSDIYIHFNSTSSITSILLGIPTFMLLPELDRKLLDRITFVKNLSITASSCDDLIMKIKESINNPDKNVLYKDISQYCENLTSENYNSSKMIIDSLDRHFKFSNTQGVILKRSFQEYLIVKLKKTKFFIFWVLGIMLSTFKVKTNKYFPPRNSYENAKAKQPTTNLKIIKEMLSNLIEGQTYNDIVLSQISQNLFIMSNRKINKLPHSKLRGIKHS